MISVFNLTSFNSILAVQRQGEESAKRFNTSRQGKSYLNTEITSNNFFPVLMNLFFWQFLPPAFQVEWWSYIMHKVSWCCNCIDGCCSFLESISDDKAIIIVKVEYSSSDGISSHGCHYSCSSSSSYFSSSSWWYCYSSSFSILLLFQWKGYYL